MHKTYIKEQYLTMTSYLDYCLVYQTRPLLYSVLINQNQNKGLLVYVKEA